MTLWGFEYREVLALLFGTALGVLLMIVLELAEAVFEEMRRR